MELKQAYQMVFNDLRECPMFQGKYTERFTLDTAWIDTEEED